MNSKVTRTERALQAMRGEQIFRWLLKIQTCSFMVHIFKMNSGHSLQSVKLSQQTPSPYHRCSVLCINTWAFALEEETHEPKGLGGFHWKKRNIWSDTPGPPTPIHKSYSRGSYFLLQIEAAEHLKKHQVDTGYSHDIAGTRRVFVLVWSWRICPNSRTFPGTEDSICQQEGKNTCSHLSRSQSRNSIRSKVSL